jgi:imidazolonepropionase-like amidohydrolase
MDMTRIVITGVRIFDGHGLLPPATVVIEDGIIAAITPDNATSLSAGGVLLPGLIDAHVHLHGRESLERLCSWGVTTALDMACGPRELLDELRGVPGLTDIRSAGIPAIAPGSAHSHIPLLGQLGLVHDPEDAARFVASRIAEGSDYIKVILGSPGGDHDQPTLDALIAAAHAHGKLVIAHAASYASAFRAMAAGVDAVTHVPLDRALDKAAVDQGVHFAIPTLAMMEAIVQRGARADADYDRARASVTALHEAGVPILAGTDANQAPGVPAAVSHGESLHRELELLVDAGLSTVDALRAATVLPAEHFGLPDRGVIEPGRRADLILIDGDPVQDIKATRSIRRIWCGGTEHLPS